MKKKLSVFICSAILAATLCSCGVSPAETFDNEAVENAYSNYMAGGKLVFKDKNLYLVNTFFEGTEAGVIKINADGAENIYKLDRFTDEKFPELFTLYDLNGKFYTNCLYDDSIYTFDESGSGLAPTEYTELPMLESDNYYIDEDYAVLPLGYTMEGIVLSVVRDGETKKIDFSFQNFFVDDGKLYGSGVDEKLHCYDIASGKFEDVPDIHIDSNTPKFFVADGYCYSTDVSGKDGEGLYRYNIKDGAPTFVTEKKVKSINSYDSKIYFAADDGVYSFDGTTSAKIANLAANELYILDNEWVYALNTENGELHRISMNSGKTEVVNYTVSSSADQAK